jgi:hypothetical protein
MSFGHRVAGEIVSSNREEIVVSGEVALRQHGSGRVAHVHL